MYCAKPKVKHAEEKKRSKGNAKSKAKKIVSCYECKIAENSDADQALAQDRLDSLLSMSRLVPRAVWRGEWCV